MFIILGVIGLLTIGIVMGIKGDWMDGYEWYGLAGFLITLISVVALFVMALSYPLGRLDYKAEIKAFEAVRQTVEIAREKETIDDTAMQLKIIESNEWLAKAQFKRSIWKSWVPKEVLDLKPIR